VWRQNDEAWRCRERHGDGFVEIGGDYMYQKAPEVISRGSRWLCTPSLLGEELKLRKKLFETKSSRT